MHDKTNQEDAPISFHDTECEKWILWSANEKCECNERMREDPTVNMAKLAYGLVTFHDYKKVGFPAIANFFGELIQDYKQQKGVRLRLCEWGDKITINEEHCPHYI